MTDISELGFRVDSASAVKATSDLDGLARQAATTETKVTQAAKRSTDAFSTLSAPMKSAKDSAAAMEAEFRRMRAEFDPLYAKSLKYSDTLDRLNRAHKLGAINAKQYDLALEQLNVAFAGFDARVGGAVGGMRGLSAAFANFDTRMAAMQLSQVAQQTSATGNFVQALAIQIPDLALGFGTFGIAAGVAAGALLPVVANMVMSGEEARELDEVMSDLASSVQGYADAAQLAMSPMSDLTEEFGRQATAIRDTLMFGAELELQRSIVALRDATSAANSELDNMRSLVDRIAAGQAYTTGGQFERMSDDLDLTLGQMQMVLAAMDQLAAARGPEEIVKEARDLRDLLTDIYGSAQNIPPELQALASAIVDADANASRLLANIQDSEASARNLADTDMATTISSAADQAARLATNMQNAAAARQAYAFDQAMADLPPGQTRAPEGGGIDTLDFEINGTDAYLPPQAGWQRQQEREERAAAAAARRAKRGSSGGGGGGMSDAQREAERRHNDMTREAERIFEDTRTAAESYARELADLNELHEMGYLDADTFGRAVEQLDEEMQEASFERMQRGIESISDAMADAIVNGENMGEALGQIFRQVAADIISSGIQQALTQAFQPAGGGGGFLGNIFGSLFGGARANGGPVYKDKAHLVGERGPEMFVPGSNGTVVSNEALRGAAGGGQLVVRVELGEGLIGQILQQTGAQSVQITQASARQQNRNFGKRFKSWQETNT